jgi:ATP-dependent RNA helicase DeaD
MDDSPNSFARLGLSPQILAAVHALGFREPSPIQAAAIPLVLQGSDVVGLSQTGSGKTAAFGLPALQLLRLADRHPQVLVLCPTRELCVQVCEQVQLLGANQGGLHVVPIYGGAPLDRQTRLLRHGVHVITATPGRLLDHLRRGLDLSQVRLAVLDEADRMLDMGFREEVESILAALPAERQTVFFSATMNPGVDALIRRFARSPKTIKIQQDTATVSRVEQRLYAVRETSKVEVLCRILELESPRLALVFCNTKRAADDCTEALLARGYPADRLHGDISQIQRERTLARFREGTVEILVATDVAARGIDIDEVDAVFNYDIPFEPEDYVHRIGRTARAGRTGTAHTFVAGRGFAKIRRIEGYTGSRITETPVPTRAAVEAKRLDLLGDAVREVLAGGEAPDCRAQLDRLAAEGFTPEQITAALFGLLRRTALRESESIPEDRPPKKTREREPDFPRASAGARPGPEPEPGDEPASPAGADGPRGELIELFLNVGRAAGVQPGDIAGMIYSEARLPKGSLGRIQLFHKHSLFRVRAEFADTVIQSTRNASLRGIPVRIAYPRPPGEHAPDRGRPPRAPAPGRKRGRPGPGRR